MRSLLLTSCLLTLLLACSQESPKTDWLVVNYWATWCAPCREEIPELNRLAAEQQQLLQVRGVNFDAPTGELAAQQEREMGVEFPTISDREASALGLKKPMVLPATFVLYRGELVQELRGPQTYESIMAVIEQ